MILQAAFTRPEHLLPGHAVLPLLPVLSVSQIPAASDTSQQQQQLSPAVPAIQTCLLAAGNVSLALSLHLASCGQIWEEVQFIIALHYFFPLFSVSSVRNTNHSHLDSLLILQSGSVSSQRPCRSKEGEQDHIAQLCWQHASTCLSVCRDREGCSLDPASCQTAASFVHISP